eukprot:3055843-Amphidinium_carterae.1
MATPYLRYLVYIGWVHVVRRQLRREMVDPRKNPNLLLSQDGSPEMDASVKCLVYICTKQKPNLLGQSPVST